MTNPEIEAFLAVARYGTVSAAAEHLFVTQPALTRRIQALEEEIGYALFLRQKGVREARLTREGEDFLPIAEKWRRLWAETGAVLSGKKQLQLNLASVGSVSHYIFPEVFPPFLAENPEYHLNFHQYHSHEAYGYVEQKMTDLAFVSDQRYARALRVRPAFSEPFVLAGGARLSEGRGAVPVEELDPAGEIRLPWNGDFDQWHVRCFPDSVYPLVFLDQMSLMEEFLTDRTWAAVPVTVACRLQKKGIRIRELKGGPPRRIIYALAHEENENPLIGRFLFHLDRYLRTLERVESWL